MKFLIINGPNLNLTGQREKEIYGNLSLKEINNTIDDACKSISVDIDFFQSNYEGDIIGKLHESKAKYSGVVINPGAFSHYSIAILDAIRSIDIPVVEVHLSNIHAREEFRRKSLTASACAGIISGFGYYGYIMAIHALVNKLKSNK